MWPQICGAIPSAVMANSTSAAIFVVVVLDVIVVFVDVVAPSSSLGAPHGSPSPLNNALSPRYDQHYKKNFNTMRRREVKGHRTTFEPRKLNIFLTQLLSHTKHFNPPFI